MGNKISRSGLYAPLLEGQHLQREVKKPKSARFTKEVFDTRILPLIDKFLEKAKKQEMKKSCRRFSKMINDDKWLLEIDIHKGIAHYHEHGVIRLAREFVLISRKTAINDEVELRKDINRTIIRLMKEKGIKYND